MSRNANRNPAFPPERRPVIATQPERPWSLPWYRATPGQGNVLAYLIVVHLLSGVGLVLFPVPGWPLFLGWLGLTLLGGLGTTVVYHRAIAHKALRLHPAIEQVLVFFAVLNGSGTPRQWTANHRKHHANSDGPDDVSSPRHGGFWWSHLGWLYQMPDASLARWAPDLDRPRYNVWGRLQTPLVVASLFGGLALGWKAMFWLGAIRLVYSLHMQCFVNSVLHMGPEGEGGEDSSVNAWWLGPLQLAAWGENWHRNHHAEPASAQFGRRFWQVDVGWYLIRALETVRLATQVRRARTGDAAPARIASALGGEAS